MATQSIFTTQTPALPNVNDAVAYTLGTVFRTSAAGTVGGIRWFFPATLPSGPVIGALFTWTDNTIGTELARATFVNPTAGAWNSVAFAVPPALSVNTRYVATVYTPDRYVATAGLFSTAVTNGPLTAPADDAVTPARNGKFRSGGTGPTYPDGSNGAGCYFVDVLFDAVPARDLDVVVGLPETTWRTAAPDTKWTTGQPATTWAVGPPRL